MTPGMAGRCSFTHVLLTQVLATKQHPPSLRSNQEVRWKGTAVYLCADREGKFYTRQVFLFSLSVSGLLSLISSGISILLWRTSAAWPNIDNLLREMVKTWQIVPLFLGSSGRFSWSRSQLDWTSLMKTLTYTHECFCNKYLLSFYVTATVQCGRHLTGSPLQKGLILPC